MPWYPPCLCEAEQYGLDWKLLRYWKDRHVGQYCSTLYIHNEKTLYNSVCGLHNGVRWCATNHMQPTILHNVSQDCAMAQQILLRQPCTKLHAQSSLMIWPNGWLVPNALDKVEALKSPEQAIWESMESTALSEVVAEWVTSSKYTGWDARHYVGTCSYLIPSPSYFSLHTSKPKHYHYSPPQFIKHFHVHVRSINYYNSSAFPHSPSESCTGTVWHHEICHQSLIAPFVMLIIRTLLLAYFVSPAWKMAFRIIISAWIIYKAWGPIRVAIFSH